MGATALVGAATASSSTTSMAEAVVVVVAMGADAATTLHVRSTPGPVRPHVLIFNRGLGSPHMRRPGSRVPRHPDRRPLKDFLARAPA
jgi:hypothetical protein